jgi:hypothetical protein
MKPLIDTNPTLALRRAFQRELGRRPTVFQRCLIDHAAVMATRASAARSRNQAK